MKTFPVWLTMTMAGTAISACAANGAEQSPKEASQRARSPAAQGSVPDKETAKQSTFTGTLRTGIMAIGGETTGVVLETEKGTYELDVRGNREASAQAEKLDGKRVTVIGDYKPRPGVEVRERRIIVVKELRAAR